MLSKITWIFCSLFMLTITFFFHPKWEKPGSETTIGWDVSGYYWYLPSIFIYKDLKHQKFGDSIIRKYAPTPDFQQSFVYQNGNRVNTYSSGMAVMYLPLFAVAHMAAKPLGYPADGFSKPYQFVLEIGSVLMAIVGIWYFRKLFLLYYTDKVVAILLLLLVVGSNYLNYTAIDGSLSHNWLFTLYVLLLLNTYHFYQKPNYSYAIRIGLLIGLMVLIRPTEIISVIIPLTCGMNSISFPAIKQRLAFFKDQISKLIVTTISAAAIGSIQIIYWLYVTGKPFVYSYQEKSFSWLHPHFRDYIFSYRSGWATYTPLVFLIFLGVPFFLVKGRNKLMVMLFSVISLYIVSAWDIWWYGGTGGRAMIQSYPVIFFFLAALIDQMLNNKRLGWIMAPFLLLFTYFNIWFTIQAHGGAGLYDPDGMNRSYFWAVAGKWHADPEIQKLKETDELFEGKPKELRLLYRNGFEDDTLYNATQPVISGNKSIFIRAHYISPGYGCTYNLDHAKWIRVQASFHCLIKEWTYWRMTQMIVKFKSKTKEIKERALRIDRYIDNGMRKDLFLDVIAPKDADSIEVVFWNKESDQEKIIDDLRIYSFNE